MKTRPADWGKAPAVPGALIAYVEERQRLNAAADGARDAAAADFAGERQREFGELAADVQRTTDAVDRLVAEQRRARDLEAAEARDLAERQSIARQFGLAIEDVV